jgi:hypothetical protein
MRLLFPLLCVCLLLLPSISPAQEQFVINGYSYFTPPEGVGTVTTVVAFLDPPNGFTYPVTLDFVNNEYTFYFQSAIATVTPGPVTTEYNYAAAQFYIYEDATKNGNFGINPPNATSPSTFQDGTVVLTGTISNLRRTDYNMPFPEPFFLAECTFTGGTKFGELVQGNNWNWHGGLSSNPVFVLQGYRHRWASKIVFAGPLPAEQTTWGNIKALYVSN